MVVLSVYTCTVARSTAGAKSCNSGLSLRPDPRIFTNVGPFQISCFHYHLFIYCCRMHAEGYVRDVSACTCICASLYTAAARKNVRYSI